MDSSVLLYRPHKNPLMRWDPDVYYHNEGSAFRKAQIWKTMVEKKLKPRCTEWQNVHFFLILTLKVLCHLWCFCVYVCICGVFWLLNDSNAFILFFSWCFLKLLDSLSIISPKSPSKNANRPPVYVAAKSFWRFYEVQAYITSSHSLQIEYWLMISSFGAARVWILIKHPNALHSQFQEKFMRSPWEIHSLIW